jgi:hypothetical protein
MAWSLWNWLTLGFSRASRSRIASALAYDSSAWSEWPVSHWRFAMLLWLAASWLWNPVMLGFSRASRSRIASDSRCDPSASCQSGEVLHNDPPV